MRKDNAAGDRLKEKAQGSHRCPARKVFRANGFTERRSKEGGEGSDSVTEGNNQISTKTQGIRIGNEYKDRVKTRSFEKERAADTSMFRRGKVQQTKGRKRKELARQTSLRLSAREKREH